MRSSAFKPISIITCAKVLFILLMSLALVNCEAKIQLTIAEDCNGKLTLEYFGIKGKVINDEEGARFGLLPLKTCVQKFKRAKGVVLDQCYLKGEKHKLFEWPEVQSKYAIQDVKFVKNTVKPVVLDHQSFVNPEGSNATVKFHMIPALSESIKHENVLSNTSRLAGSLNVRFLDFNGLVGTSYEHTWGQTEIQFHKKTMDTGIFSRTVISPYSNVTIEWSGFQMTSVFDITYQNYVTGFVVGVVYDSNKTHHLLVDVKNLVPASSFVHSYTERIQIDHYKGDVVKLIRYQV